MVESGTSVFAVYEKDTLNSNVSNVEIAKLKGGHYNAKEIKNQ